MLAVGDPLPNVSVWTAPREPRALPDLLDGRAALFLFYLFDWSST